MWRQTTRLLRLELRLSAQSLNNIEAWVVMQWNRTNSVTVDKKCRIMNHKNCSFHIICVMLCIQKMCASCEEKKAYNLLNFIRNIFLSTLYIFNDKKCDNLFQYYYKNDTVWLFPCAHFTAVVDKTYDFVCVPIQANKNVHFILFAIYRFR